MIFAGGLDETVEREEIDRLNVTWPGNQLELVAELEKVGKPLVVAQFGGGQLDDTALKNSKAVCLLPLLAFALRICPFGLGVSRSAVHSLWPTCC